MLAQRVRASTDVVDAPLKVQFRVEETHQGEGCNPYMHKTSEKDEKQQIVEDLQQGSAGFSSFKVHQDP